MGDFEVHKIVIETLGEYLVGLREDLGVSVESVAEDIGIAPKFIFALEKGNFHELPESVYVVAILKKLAKRYNINAELLISEFNRELNLSKQDTRLLGNTWQVLAHRLAPLNWKSILAVFIGVMFLGLCIWQVVAIGITPTVRVTSPKSGDKVSGRLVEVTGSATPGSEVLINGQIVYAGSDGKFSGSLSFMPGTQIVTVSAKSRFGKVKSQTISFVVEAPALSEAVEPNLANNSKLNTKLVR